MIHDSWNSFSVHDLEEARDFYHRVMGFPVTQTDMGLLELHPPGGNKVLIYPKKDHVPATFTVLNFMTENIDKDADQLLKTGITFERYPGFETDEKGIVRAGKGPVIAWFKDPSGNILALIEQDLNE